MRYFQDKSGKLYRANQRVLPRLLLALACAVSYGLPSYAQESVLRGTVKENDVTNDLQLKKKRKVSKPETTQENTTAARNLQERYQPAELDANSAEATNSSVNGIADIGLQNRSFVDSGAANSTGAEPSGDNNLGAPIIDRTATGTTTILESEIPLPTTRVASHGSIERDDVGRIESENERASAIEGIDGLDDTDPYAAPGIRVGTFTLRPTFNQGVRYTNNADNSATGTNAFVSETELRLRAESDWLRHSLNIEANGKFRKSISGQTVSDPSLGFAANLGLDLSTDTQMSASVGWDHAEEDASAPTVLTGPLTRPNLDTLRASVGVAYDPGLFGLSATGQIVRQMYGSAKDSTGASISQDDRNNNFASLTLRGTYDLSPSLSPFVEGDLGRRFYDSSTDAAGLQRSATRYGLRAGVAANLSEKLNGEFAVGWLTENIDDAALSDISGLDLRGSLNWSPVRGTTVAMGLGTTIEGTTSASSSGSVLYSGTVDFRRTLRANVDANFLLGAGLRQYDGTNPKEALLSAEIGTTWWFNRYAGVNGRLRHERTLSSDVTRATSETSAYLGITLRR